MRPYSNTSHVTPARKSIDSIAEPRAVLERAVRELYAREIADERDVFDDLADLEARVAALEAARDTA